MLTDDTLARKPSAFTSMTGVTVDEFAELLVDLRPRYEAARQDEGAARARRRAPGGGAKRRDALREQLLMTRVCLRLSLTGDAVGVLFAVDKSTVSRYTRPLLRLLPNRGQDTLGWPEEARALMDTADGVDDVAISDATAQRVERSRDYATQQAHDAGTQQAHTRKTLIVVNERGCVRDVSPSVSGAIHDLTLRRPSGTREEIPPALSLMADSGFQGLHNDAPAQNLHNALLSRVRIVVENTLAAMKHFRIFTDVFHHSLDRYDSIFVSIAGVFTRRADRRLPDQRRAALSVVA